MSSIHYFAMQPANHSLPIVQIIPLDEAGPEKQHSQLICDKARAGLSRHGAVKK